MKSKPADKIQDLQFFGEFGGVIPSVSDSSTYTFLSAKSMSETFEGNTDGCYLYSRNSSPSNLYLEEALAAMEETESANVFSSGMAAITSSILQICKSNDHIISSRTVYGGTYTFLKNFTPKFNIKTSFVDTSKPDEIIKAITSKTKIIYCEVVSNPLLEVSDIKSIAEIAKKNNIKLVVDNTFSPLSVTPSKLGADIVIHSITKFINGTSDTIAGVVCSTKEFIDQLSASKAKYLLIDAPDSYGGAGKLWVDGIDYEKRHTQIYSYLNENYKFHKNVNGWIFYEKKN